MAPRALTRAAPPSRWERRLRDLSAWLVAPVHGSTLGVFRMGLAFNMIVQNGHFHSMFRLFERSTLTMPYPGLGFFLPPTPATGDAMLALNLWSLYFLFFGCFTRVAAVVNWITFTWLFSICESNHNNHYVLLCHVAFLAACVDLSWMSVDRELVLAWRRARARHRGLRNARHTRADKLIPRWHLLTMQLIMSIPYFFGAIAKMNVDWAIRSQPATMWFGRRDHWVYSLPYFSTFISLGGIGFDLTIVPILFSPLRYVIGFPAALFFNAMNKFMFNIGVFPLVMTCSLVLFLPPAFFAHIPVMAHKYLSDLLNPRVSATDMANDLRTHAVPDWFGASTKKEKQDDDRDVESSNPPGEERRAREHASGRWGWLTRARLVPLVFMTGLTVFHVSFCQRHFVLYGGDPSWTEEGHFHAWHMMLRSKHGDAVVRVFTDEAELRECEDAPFSCEGGVLIHMEDDVGVGHRQMRKVTSKPHCMLLWIDHLKRASTKAGRPLAGVLVDDCYALNARKEQKQTIPGVNLLPYANRYEIMGTTAIGKWMYPVVPNFAPFPEEVKCEMDALRRRYDRRKAKAWFSQLYSDAGIQPQGKVWRVDGGEEAYLWDARGRRGWWNGWWDTSEA